VAVGIRLVETLIDVVEWVYAGSIHTGKEKIFKYQMPSDVISKIHIVSVDFVHCHE